MTKTAEDILMWASEQAQQAFGARLLACYALGSLAHGGFCPLVSDVDFGIILSDPLEEADAERIAVIQGKAPAAFAAEPLGARVSIFWGSRASFLGQSALGRFPPADRWDLVRHGRLLHGKNVREELAAPTQAEMVIGGAAFMLRYLDGWDFLALMQEPQQLAAAGARNLTKRILFPVRLLYTARTGDVGLNAESVAHYVAHAASAPAALASAALEWRSRTVEPDDPAALELLRLGLRPVYRDFFEEYKERMLAHGEAKLAERLDSWLLRLA